MQDTWKIATLKTAQCTSSSLSVSEDAGFEIPGATPAPRRYFIQYAGSPIRIPALCAGKCSR